MRLRHGLSACKAQRCQLSTDGVGHRSDLLHSTYCRVRLSNGFLTPSISTLAALSAHATVKDGRKDSQRHQTSGDHFDPSTRSARVSARISLVHSFFSFPFATRNHGRSRQTAKTSMSSTGHDRGPPLSATDSTSSRIAEQEGIEPAKQQEPFPPAGTFPDQRSPPPVHPGVERLLNFAARHVVPDRPGPSSSEDEDDDGPGLGPKGSQAETAARPTNKQDHQDDKQRLNDAQRRDDHEAAARERAQREEEPIIAGTPLDEMTPFVENGGNQTTAGVAGYPFTSKPSQAARQASARSVRPISAVHEEDADDESESNRERTARQSPRTQRPGYGQGHEMGSVGASSIRLDLPRFPARHLLVCSSVCHLAGRRVWAVFQAPPA